MSVEEASNVALQRIAVVKPKSRLWYRVNAVRTTLGGRRLIPGPSSLTSVPENTQVTRNSGMMPACLVIASLWRKQGSDRELVVYSSEVHQQETLEGCLFIRPMI